MRTKLTGEQVNALYPVFGVRIRRRVLVVFRRGGGGITPKAPPKRGSVKMLSRRSLSRFVLTVSSSSVEWRSLLTLTYGPNYPLSGKTAKKHLRAFLAALRRRFPDVQYFWFLEFQRRGAPHFHLGLTLDAPRDRETREWLAFAWARIVEPEMWLYCRLVDRPQDGHVVGGGDVRTAVFSQHRRRSVWENERVEGGIIRYVVAYVGKPHQKRVPPAYSDVGRFWGVSGGVGDTGFSDALATDAQVRELAELLGRDLGDFEVLPTIIFHSGRVDIQKFDNVPLFD